MASSGRKSVLSINKTANGSFRSASGRVTLPRQTGPGGKLEHHLEEGHDEEDAETVHGGVQSRGGCSVR
jgi:hypothetical protein